MSPEAQLHEHALPQLQQAEVLHQVSEVLHQHAEVTPHIPEHHNHDEHDHHIEMRGTHACAPDCPEHGGSYHSHTDGHHHGHEHAQESHTIQRKTPEHACGADCPGHRHDQSHDYAQERHVEVKENADSPTEQQAEAARVRHQIEEELQVREPQSSQAAKHDTPPKATTERQAVHDQRAAAEQFPKPVEESVAVESFIEAVREKTEQEAPSTAASLVVADRQPAEYQFITAETTYAETTSGSQSTFPATMYAEMAVEPDVSGMAPTSEATIADSYEKATPALRETDLLSMRDEPIPMPITVIPELPASPEPLNTATATIAETIAQRYKSVAEALGVEESDMSPLLSPAQISELRTIVAVIQARAIQSENLTIPSNVMPQEFIRLLHLLGFENPAKTFERYTQQYGYGFYDNLLAQLFELLRVVEPIEAPVLQASSITSTAQTDWTATLGKAAVLLYRE